MPVQPAVFGERSPLGLFGGRFDPVHRAHMAMAQAAADQLSLGEIRWIVSGRAVHKAAIASAKDRLAMTQLALQDLGDARMVIDDREVKASLRGEETPSYQTVASFQAQYPGRPLVWILGEDQFSTFTHWQRWEWLVTQLTLAVLQRPDQTEGRQQALPQLERAGARVVKISVAPDPISSTEIRARVVKGLSIEASVSRSVERYILAHGIYSSTPSIAGEPL